MGARGKVLRQPRKWISKNEKEPLDLVVQAKVQFPDAVGPSDMLVPV